MHANLKSLAVCFIILFSNTFLFPQTSSFIKEITSYSVPVGLSYTIDDKKIISADLDFKIRLWDIQDKFVDKTLEGHKNYITDYNLSPNGRMLVSSSLDKTIKLWDLETGTLIYTMTGHSDVVSKVSFSPDGKTIVSGGYDRTIKLWNVETGRCISTFPKTEERVNSVNFSPDGTRLISTTGDNINGTSQFQLWDVKNNALIDKNYMSHVDNKFSFNYATQIIYSGDGKNILFTVPKESSLYVYNIETSKFKTFNLTSSQYYNVVLTQDPDIIYCSSFSDVAVISLSSSFETYRLTFDQGITGFSFSHNNRYYVVGPDYRKNKKSFKIFEIQNFPQNNPVIAEIKTLIPDSANLNILIHNHMQNNQVGSPFLVNPDGSCMLYYNNVLYKRLNKEGDNWGSAIEGINAVSFDPKNSNIIYIIAKDNSIQKSMDGGNHWITIQNGLPQGFNPTRLLINPNNNSEVFLSGPNGLYKTSDAGFTWRPVRTGVNLFQFAVSSSINNKLYIVNSEGIDLSKDAGLAWKNICGNLPKKQIKVKGKTPVYKPISVYFIIPVNFPDTSFLLAQTENGLFRTSDDGETWQESNTGFSKGDIIYSFFFSENEIFLGAGDPGIDFQHTRPVIYKSGKSADKWEKINMHTNDLNQIDGIYKDLGYPGLFVKSNNKLGYLDASLNVIGLNYGVNPHSNIIMLKNVELGTKRTLFAVVHNNNNLDVLPHGLWKSTNDGYTWKQSLLYENNGYGEAPHLVDMKVSPHNSSEIWFFDNGNNYLSMDGGNSWEPVHSKYNIPNSIYDFSFDPVDPNVLYFTSGTYFVYSYDTQLYRYDKTTGGTTQICSPSTFFRVGEKDNKYILSNNNRLEYKRTTDGGWTWSDINGIKEAISSKWSFGHSMLISGGKDYNLVAVGFLLFSSPDADKWTLLKQFDADIVSVSSNPRNKNDMLIMLHKYDDEFTLINNNADTWNQLLHFYKNDNNPLNGSWSGTVFSPFDGKKRIYLFGGSGLVFTEDNGKNWSRLGGIQ